MLLGIFSHVNNIVEIQSVQYCRLYLGIGWEVGTTETNLGQLAICSCTLGQEAMWDLIFTRVT